MKKGFVKYLFLLLFCQPSFAQENQYNVQLINHVNLTAPGEIIQLFKDDNGFMWMLSLSKLQRYDGRGFIDFYFNDKCINVQEDNEGAIWLLTSKTIFRYTNAYKGFETVLQQNKSTGEFLAMTTANGKHIYILSQHHLLTRNEEKGTFDTIAVPPFESGGSFPFLKSQGDYLFYNYHDSALVRLYLPTLKEEVVKVSSPSYLFPVNKDTVWVRQSIGNSALVSFLAGTVVPLSNKNFVEPFDNNDFFITGCASNMSFFSIKDKGYFFYEAKKKKFHRIRLLCKGLPFEGDTPLNSFYQDRIGDIWFANELGIVRLITNNSISLLRSNVFLGEVWKNDIRNFAEDADGNIWFATSNGFCKWDKEASKVKSWLPKPGIDNYLNFSSIRSIGYSGGKIIVGQSEKGYWIFDPVNNSFIRPVYENDSIKKELEKSYNTNMVALRNGNFLILSKKLWVLDKHTFAIKQLPFNPTVTYFRKAFQDPLGRIWLVGNAGIFCMDENYKLMYSLPDNVLGQWLNAIVQVDESTFWVAAKNLFEVKMQPDGRLQVHPIFPELKNTHFSNLYKDSLQHIWMFSDDGIYRYIPETKQTEKFDETDNAQVYYPNISNAFRASDGILYAGSTNGINYFVPEKVPLQFHQIKTILSNVVVNGDDSIFLLRRPFPRLKYFQNSILFSFIAPFVCNGQKVLYRYKLDGADNDWVYSNSGNGHYTSLKPGKYIFYVAASLNGKDWSQCIPFSFSIAPVFWQTWWFELLAFLLLASFTYYLIYRREKNITQKQLQKTEFEKLRVANYQNQLEIEQVVNYFATSIGSQTNIEDMLWDVAKNCISKLGFEDCIIYLKDDEREVLLQKAAWGPKTNEGNKIISPIEIPFGKGIVGTVAKTGRAEIIEDTSLDERYIIDDANRLSEIAVPLIKNGQVIGVIDSEHTSRKFYTKQHLQILTTITIMLSDNIAKMQAAEQAKEREIEVLRLSKDLSNWQIAALRAQMNPHFIFNAMNSIQQFTLQHDVDNANLYISKFSTLLRKVLHSSQKNFISLDEEIEQLTLYLDIEKLRLGSEFHFSIHSNEISELDAIKIPGMLIQPFVENALKHGLSPKDGEKLLEIKFLLNEDDKLQVHVKDNGVGTKKAKALNDQNKKLLPYESRGMAMVEERLTLLNNKPGATHYVIEDLYNAAGQACGTHVTLEIPLQH